MFEMGWLLERREAVTLALVEIAGWAFLYLQERLFRPTSSQDMWFLQQTELWWDTLHSQKQGLPFQQSSIQKKCCMSLSFSKGTHVHSCWNSVYFLKRLLFWVPAFVNLFPTWSHERQRRMLNRPFPGLHCQGQPKENWRHNQLKPLIFQPRWPREPTILEAVDLQLGLQLPQNTRPFVWVLSATLSLFGNKPWCNPLEMTKEIKAQLWSKDSSSGMLASEVAQKQAGLAHRHAFLVSFRG